MRQIGFLRYWLFAILVFLIYSNILAQPDLKFYRYPTDRAPGNKMHAVYKDQLGYLWIGKPDGLIRHDGINFDLYTHDPRDSTSISNNNVRVVFQDSKQRLWIGTFTGGLCLFDYTNETFKKYSFPTDLYQGSLEDDEGVWVIFEDIDENVWIGTRHHGLQVLDEKTLQFKAYLPGGVNPERIEYHTIRSAIPQKNDPYKYWIGTRRALFEFDLKTRKFEKHEMKVRRYDADSAATVYCITEDTDSTVFTGGWGGGLLRYNFKKRTVEQFLYKELLSSANIVFDVFKLNDSAVLLGTGDRALIHYDLDNRKHYWYAYDESRSNRSWRGQVYDTYLDNTGMVWMAQAHGFTSFRLYKDTTPVDVKPKDQYLSTIKIPPLLLQPFVENAIWHGLMHRKEGGNLQIEIKLENGSLTCIVEDNGIGRRMSAKIRSKAPNRKKSMGSGITQNRVDLIKKLYQIEANISIIDLPNDAGTKVFITLPQEN